MLRNIITGSKVVEIYKVGSDLPRGSVVAKNLTTKVADKATTGSAETYLLDFDAQPTGCMSDVEISAYDSTMDTVKAGSLAILITPAVGSQWASDQVTATGLTAGDYLVADDGKLVKATTGQTSTYRYIGEYMDGNVKLHQFEVVFPHTV
ncbi:hypothetical protein EDM57_05160 [Brevibacillus gelatini]|uniref:DUF2190 family protein n=1 Tax=Brevibacillus gelatini TaxID=1655277 RepID=A0A3M8B8A4_9BACL|nr:hypothetical protein [Brevibacillus gelatini]RNB59532.1 hypothetical protein EDM57_05160 [Brevibacillus gelatini]